MILAFVPSNCSRVMSGLRAMPATELTAYDLVAHKHLVLLDGALEALAGRVASVPAAAAAEGSE